MRMGPRSMSDSERLLTLSKATIWSICYRLYVQLRLSVHPDEHLLLHFRVLDSSRHRRLAQVVSKCRYLRFFRFKLELFKFPYDLLDMDGVK